MIWLYLHAKRYHECVPGIARDKFIKTLPNLQDNEEEIEECISEIKMDRDIFNL